MSSQADGFRYRCCFVILHYKTMDETMACIESILQLDGIEMDAIVIVDNSHQVSDTGRRLSVQYAVRGNIYFVANSDNQSFSYGNNLGYRYAKGLGGRFIIVTNSDTLFPQKNFCTRVAKIMGKHSFHICGPNIVEPVSGSGTSPIAWECPRIEETRSEIAYYHREIKKIVCGGGV